MNRYNPRNSQGFTLIELMLAMTFISLLLLAIAMTTIQISGIYTKGITFQSVNQAGRTLSDDLRRDIAVSAPFTVDNPDRANDTSRRYVKQFTSGSESGGRLCVGNVSYVWNYGKYIKGGVASSVNKYLNPDSNTQIRLVRVVDSGGQLCSDVALKVDKSAATELLGGKDNLDLALHDFTITSSPAATDAASGQKMYVISFTIGTNEQAALTTNNTQCVPPGSTDASKDADWEYCAVNVFDIVVRAGN